MSPNDPRRDEVPLPPTKGEASRQLESLLGIGAARAKRPLRRWLFILALLLVIVLGALLVRRGNDAAAPVYLTEAVRRGDLTVLVSATGNVQPTHAIEVGSELSGTIEAVLVDENDRVTRGQVLAQLDVSRLRDQIARAKGALAAAQASAAQAAATATEKRLYFDRLEAMAKISHGSIPARTDIDAARAALDRAVADVAGAKAAISQARAALGTEETNLSKASIRAPIDGVVLTRAIEPGQTVAASLQAPVLFTLAENLSQMELQVDVDEADVGQVHEGQAAMFTVDAYPGRRYPATIQRVGLGSRIKDGVVSYLTVLSVDNDDLSLRPGMTATAEIVTAERRGVLLVPSGALRFAPPSSELAPTTGRSFISRLLPRPPHPTSKPATKRTMGPQREVWILRDGVPSPVAVTIGATDGRSTEVADSALAEGALVITGLSGSSS
ncbi:efflux RND transporter periplasmic adaptor subunit [Dokdonella immobilis]|uniref:HlyD family secretion protein n=1 Tax=Dokdonella immobilis TaxID=578942 RepID=A0A1I4ZBS0_9GAMM|nr:efflux RND transporter periplasmic adaptor subunit [Dokdonella immobilis]SFN47350.1 HlyD family secretion protein [Dokdonella immobilis]